MIRVTLEEAVYADTYALSDLSDVRVTCEVPVKNQWYIIASAKNGIWYIERELRTYVAGAFVNGQKTKMPELVKDGKLVLVCERKEYIDERRILGFEEFDLRKEIKKRI